MTLMNKTNLKNGNRKNKVVVMMAMMWITMHHNTRMKMKKKMKKVNDV